MCPAPLSLPPGGNLGRAEKRLRPELLRRPLPKTCDSLQSQPSRRPRVGPVSPTPHGLTGSLATEAKLPSPSTFFFGASLTQLPSKVLRDRREGWSAANQGVRPDGSREAPGSCPEVPTGKRKRRAARGGGAGPRVLRPLGL